MANPVRDLYQEAMSRAALTERRNPLTLEAGEVSTGGNTPVFVPPPVPGLTLDPQQVSIMPTPARSDCWYLDPTPNLLLRPPRAVNSNGHVVPTGKIGRSQSFSGANRGST
jgi:hypothetical protein